MRFLIRLLLFAALIAAVHVNLLAQRGHAAVSAGHSSYAGRPYSGFSMPAAGYGGLRAPAAGYTGIHPGALRSRGYGRDYRHMPFGYFFNPYYYPFLDYSSAPEGGSPYDMSGDPNAQADIMAQNSLGEQIQRLNAAVGQLAYNQESQQAAAYPQQSSQPLPQSPPVMLVLRSGQQLEVQSYAVMDQTFWDFTHQQARKIPISSIDIAASAKATEAKGGEFPQLESGQ